MPDPNALLAALKNLLSLGGPAMLALMVLAVAALMIGLVKSWQLLCAGRQSRSRPIEQALSQWQNDNPEGALDTLAREHHPVADLLQLAIRGRRDKADDTLLQTELHRRGQSAMTALDSWLRPLELIAAAAPLIGLLGTVLGMIDAFRSLQLAGTQADPAILSAGIWQALLTTAAGLVVAIPVMLWHGWLERRVDAYAQHLQDSVTRVFTRDLHREHAQTWSQPRLFDDKRQPPLPR